MISAGALVTANTYDAWCPYQQLLAVNERELVNLTIALATGTARSVEAADVLVRETSAWYESAGRGEDGNAVADALPSRAVGVSMVNVMGTIYYWRTDDPWGGRVIDEWVLADNRAEMWDNVIDWIEKGIIKPGSYANFHYHRFMKDPMGTIESAYRAIGLTVDPKAFADMKAHLDSVPQGAHGKHNYKRAAEDPTVLSDERKKYQRYQQYFDIPNEA